MDALVINGSPKGKNSNTMNITRAFLEGAGWQSAEVVNISEADVKGCRGCFSCWRDAGANCVINDCMSEILPKLIAADVVIWSFPLYYYSVPGCLKNLIDRRLPLSLPSMDSGKESGSHPPRYDLSHQRNIIISTCGFWTPQGNYNAVMAMFDHIFEKGNYPAILCGQGELFRVPQVKERTDKYLAVVRRAGQEYANGKISAQTQAELAEPFLPREIFERAANSAWAQKPE